VNHCNTGNYGSQGNQGNLRLGYERL
jgi:hypothetical protein